MLGVPGVAFLDYEHASQVAYGFATKILWLPDLLRDVHMSRSVRRWAQYYPGLKENLYLDRWIGDRASERAALGISGSAVLVVARPPASSAHYTRGDGDSHWHAIVRGVLQWANVEVIVVPRDARQREHLRRSLPANANCRVLDDVRPGPGLVTAADLVIGGGGTMNREAAVLGVPAWSTFSGPPPRIDERLAEEGRLRWVRSSAAVAETLAAGLPQRRERRGPFPEGLRMITDGLATLLGIG